MATRSSVGWLRALARPVVDRRTGEELRTLFDVRAYIIKREPGEYDRHWQRAMELLQDASKGGEMEALTKQLELAMFLEGRLKF